MYAQILIAYDGRPESEAALRQGLGLAEALKADVVIVGIHAIDPAILIAEASAPSDLPARMAQEFREDLEAEAAAHRAKGLAVKVVCSEGDEADAATTICATAADAKADLIVIGHRHKKALSKLFEHSTEGSILERLSCNLLVVGSGD